MKHFTCRSHFYNCDILIALTNPKRSFLFKLMSLHSLDGIFLSEGIVSDLMLQLISAGDEITLTEQKCSVKEVPPSFPVFGDGILRCLGYHIDETWAASLSSASYQLVRFV